MLLRKMRMKTKIKKVSERIDFSEKKMSVKGKLKRKIFSLPCFNVAQDYSFRIHISFRNF